jgi:hypothetical protein
MELWKHKSTLVLKLLLTIVAFAINMYISLTKMLTLLVLPLAYYYLLKQLLKESDRGRLHAEWRQSIELREKNRVFVVYPIFYKYINSGVSRLREIIMLRNPLKSFASLVALLIGSFVANKLGDWMLFWCLVWLRLLYLIVVAPS